jgi:DHA1 family inner membrane transport protein
MRAGRRFDMGQDRNDRGWMIPVVALFLSAFAICTAEFIIAGLLPAIAADLKVDIPTAGLLISGYALGVAIASPVFALLTGKVPRRPLMMVLMGIFVLGNILCALSTTYWMLLSARLLVACCHGLFFGVALVLAMRLAPPDRQTSAVSLVVAGVTLASVLGVPLGTAIGNAYGWRATFLVIAGAGALATLAVALLVRAAPEQTAAVSNLSAELRAVLRPPVLLTYTIIAFFMVGVMVLYSYIVPLLTTVSGVPLAYVPVVLFGMGFFGVFGNLIGGRLADRRPFTTMIGILVALAVVILAMAPMAHSALGITACLWLAYLVAFGFPAPIQTRVLSYAADAPNLASTLLSTAFNIGVAIGAALGAAVINAGLGYASLPLFDAAAQGIALVLLIGLVLLDRRLAAPAAVPA